ncbi:related to GCR1-dependent translation factor 1 [Saccharomycodes ludwigii]|uniref:GDT1 family protein n=1 Tax=Saccharomycodes ludwigii TaxID=36035 RepID=A0A376B653_9ASCO|nr:hypothetical protein SCDLUD_003091 [Saccharomycodes ludwigii]KAH3900123.1 hypothetical protein SCDLUD_003091 [Saccharomycodes ludwigii]SSD60049.1 related to GCR1-dependent translation factor 1 [Saccharomycodes ludwigii]
MHQKNILFVTSLLLAFFLQACLANGIVDISQPNITIAAENNDDDLYVDNPVKSFFLAISMIIVSEIGDKTFIIAVLMAMRNSKWTVFFGSASSLVIMTILSGILGHSITTLISEKPVTLLGALCFFLFGYATLKEALQMSSSTGVEETMAEVKEEMSVKNLNKALNNAEKGGDARKSGINSSRSYSFNNVIRRFTKFLSYMFSPIFLQVFVMVFLGEIGDRSQISIIIMGFTDKYWLCILAACIGNILCSSIAVIGGSLLASKVSMKTVSLIGASVFFLFGFVYIIHFLRF